MAGGVASRSLAPMAWMLLLIVLLPSALFIGHSAIDSTEPAAASSASASSSPGGCFGYNHVNDTAIPTILGSLRIAVIQPILTATPYSQYDTGSFYAFYAKESGVTTNVTAAADLALLSTNVSSGSGFNDGWGLSYGMYKFITSQTAADCGLTLGKNVHILTDMDVANGGLFYPQNHTARFDVVILPFSEYVEAQEYLAYEGFVAGGGTLVMMAHSLEYPVTYNATTNVETLVYGHGWAFNGKYAYPVPCGSNTYMESCPWAGNNTDWTGSNSCEASCFHTYVYNGSVVNAGSPIGRDLAAEFGGLAFKSYVAHEENTVTNLTDTSIVSVFVNDSTNLIASYTHQFRKGLVVCFGVFGDDIIATDQSAQYFMLLGMISGRGASALTSGSAATSATPSVAQSSTSIMQTPTTTNQRAPGASSATLEIVSAAAAAAVVVAGILVLGLRASRHRKDGSRSQG
jgi:hypothetical protein